MRSIIRAFGAVVAAGTMLVGAGVAGAAPPEQDDAELQGVVGAITWAACTDPWAPEGVECGKLNLPIDWKNPRGEKFDLAVARRKATDPAKRVGIMLINPGGPGGSGVDFAYGANNYFSPEVQASFDIIGFDPRGVARSQPVTCSLDLLNAQPTLFPKDQAEFDRLKAYNQELAKDCRARSGPIFDHADTIAVTNDMDAIRRSLGERKMNYYGISYGTIMGQQYAERFGSRIRAMVVDSNMDHSLDVKAFHGTEASAAEDSFQEFVKWCDRTGSCALHGRDVAAYWDDLLAKADRGELKDPDDPTRSIAADEITGRAFSSFYGPGWSFLATWLDRLGTGAPAPATASAAADEVAENPFPAVFCQDFQYRVRNHRELATLVAEARRLAPHMRGSSLGHYAVASCVGYPPKANNPQHDLRITAGPKILMMNALHDPATAYAWAANAHRQSRAKTVLLTYEGWGHGAYRRSDCARAASDGYLVGLTVPREGTRCPAVEPAPEPEVTTLGTTSPVGPKPGLPGWGR
ncbi:alpha/beta hydrolase [Umezawaea endophytica]|uniref:Alpha/beta hydrolase n=1 Tax=Umezawaea endophytica TaxID=1654476 RepID=A0A9X2VV23_9PSEU|nr:alpha/beta hydrolase [Umezawaea endophytica]MCS7482589.1 alpha/beta hydrolase [Umezawaea endophytica]